MNLREFLFPPRRLPQRVVYEFTHYLRVAVLQRMERPSDLIEQLRAVRSEIETLIHFLEDRDPKPSPETRRKILSRFLAGKEAA
jgi:hypothetical protein